MSLRSSVRRARRLLLEGIGSDRYSRTSQFGVEERMLTYLGGTPGIFIEAGANDGVSQSNTYWLERFRGWRGLLIEPIPAVAEECRRNRPSAIVKNCALVADSSVKSIKVAAVGLYGYVTGSLSSAEHESHHRKTGAHFAGLRSAAEILDVDVPARTLESILDEVQIGPIDFFSLDVEGYEVSVLQGMNMNRFRPRFLFVEDIGPDRLLSAFGQHYDYVEQITRHDVLLKAKAPI